MDMCLLKFDIYQAKKIHLVHCSIVSDCVGLKKLYSGLILTVHIVNIVNIVNLVSVDNIVSLVNIVNPSRPLQAFVKPFEAPQRSVKIKI